MVGPCPFVTVTGYNSKSARDKLVFGTAKFWCKNFSVQNSLDERAVWIQILGGNKRRERHAFKLQTTLHYSAKQYALH